MSKFIVVVLSLLVLSMSATFEQVRTIVEKDKCATNAMDKFQTEIEMKMATLREVKIIFIVE